jgi:hypothetical protein
MFSYGGTRSQVVQRVLNPPRVTTLAHQRHSNTVWAVQQGVKEPYLVCYILGQDPAFGWGFLELREHTHTPCNCPLAFLELAPEVIDARWRERVRNFDREHRKKPQLKETWALKNQLIPHVMICEVSPRLKGIYQGNIYPVRLSMLGQRLRAAPG